MAPTQRARGRPRKIGNTRMDAAVDAMKQMGFPQKLVCETVKELLEVYEGDDTGTGWPFIEEAAYTVLIDKLLEKQQDEAENRGTSTQHDAICNGNDALALAAAGAPSAVFPGDSLPPKRRRPCYGWICEDDDDEPLVELQPAPLPELVRLLVRREK